MASVTSELSSGVESDPGEGRWPPDNLGRHIVTLPHNLTDLQQTIDRTLDSLDVDMVLFVF